MFYSLILRRNDRTTFYNMYHILLSFTSEKTISCTTKEQLQPQTAYNQSEKTEPTHISKRPLEIITSKCHFLNCLFQQNL